VTKDSPNSVNLPAPDAALIVDEIERLRALVSDLWEVIGDMGSKGHKANDPVPTGYLDADASALLQAVLGDG
jgi:hypothetical protein